MNEGRERRIVIIDAFDDFAFRLLFYDFYDPDP